jgi:hypothetical protein
MPGLGILLHYRDEKLVDITVRGRRSIAAGPQSGS